MTSGGALELGRGPSRRHLEAYLGLVTAYLKRHLATHGHRVVQATGTVSDLFVSLVEVQRHLGFASGLAGGAARVPGCPDATAIDDEIATRRELITTFLEDQAAHAEHAPLPIEELRATYRLDEREVELLLAAAAPAVSIDLARLFTFAWADFSVKQPTVGFLAELCAAGAVSPMDLAQAFRADAPLVRHGLVTLGPHPAWQPTPRLHATVTVPDALLGFLLGQPGERAPAIVGLRALAAPSPEAATRPLVMADEVVVEVERILQWALGSADRRPLIGLVGRPRSGRRSLLARALARVGVGLVVADLRVMPGDVTTLAETLVRVGREALLRGAALLLRGEGTLDDDAWLERSGEALRQLAGAHPGIIAFTARRVAPSLHEVLPASHDITFAAPSRVEQSGAWAQALAASGCAYDDSLPERMAARTNLPIGAIIDATDEAARRIQRSGARRREQRLDLGALAKAVHRRAQGILADLAEPFATTLDWSDIVLDEATRRVLDEIVVHARLRDQVYDGWGFRRSLSYGRGLSCLFSGPPGTGKTMMAAIVAQTLERELYRIDLSRVTSKWIGESMKSLGRIFAEAEQANVILLFDEADSLFAKRTQVQSSNDRFANMEVNFLLQKMESFDGMTILTTNFDESIDVAFRRRIRFRVEFRMPTSEERAELWRTMLPPGVPRARDIDFGELGRRFQMSGGSIKNALLRAAFHAAGSGAALNQAHLRTAAEAEAREMGLLVRG